jgi:hypothetical protein
VASNEAAPSAEEVAVDELSTNQLMGQLATMQSVMRIDDNTPSISGVSTTDSIGGALR